MKSVVIGGLVLVGLVAIGALVVAMFGSPIHSSVPIGYASLVSPTRIEIGAECGTDEIATVRESEQTVVVELRLKVRPGDCASGTTIELEAPFGERHLIDGTTGERVEVEGATDDD